MKAAIAAAVLTLIAGAARAEVLDSTDGSLRIRNTVEIAATPARAYGALAEVGRWWEGAHTFSGSASNLTLDLKPGGCFCEALPNGGGVRHGVVAMVWPDQGMIRLETALGPLQNEGVAGALTFQVKAKGRGVEVIQTYHVGGLRPASATALAGPVDQVLRTQLVRYGKFVATGKPD